MQNELKWLYVKDADKNKTYLYFDGENLLLARYHKYSDPVHEGREGYWWHNAVGIYGARLSSLEGYDIVYEMSEMPSFKAPTLKKGLNVRLKDEVISGTVFKPREGFKYVYFFITEVFEDQGVIKYKLSKNWRGAAVIIVERDDILLVDY